LKTLRGLEKAPSDEETFNTWITEWFINCAIYREHLKDKFRTTVTAVLKEKPKKGSSGKLLSASFPQVEAVGYLMGTK